MLWNRFFYPAAAIYKGKTQLVVLDFFACGVCYFHKLLPKFPQLALKFSTTCSQIFHNLPFSTIYFLFSETFHDLLFSFHDLHKIQISAKFSTIYQKCSFHNFFHDFKGGVTLCHLYGRRLSPPWGTLTLIEPTRGKLFSEAMDRSGVPVGSSLRHEVF